MFYGRAAKGKTSPSGRARPARCQDRSTEKEAQRSRTGARGSLMFPLQERRPRTVCAQSTARERGLSAHGDSIDKGVPGRGGSMGEETAAGEGRALFAFDPGGGRGGRYNHLVLARSKIQEVFPLAACPWLAENSRLGFRLVGSTLHQGPQPFKYLNGVGDTTSVVWNAWPESLKAQQRDRPLLHARAILLADAGTVLTERSLRVRRWI